MPRSDAEERREEKRRDQEKRAALRKLRKDGTLHINKRTSHCKRHKCAAGEDGDDHHQARYTCEQCFAEGAAMIGAIWLERYQGAPCPRPDRLPALVGRIGDMVEARVRQGAITEW